MSATYIDRFEPLIQCLPWQRNHAWLPTTLVLSVGIIITTVNAVHNGTNSAMPWYFYILVVVLPFGCMAWNEAWKKVEGRVEARAEKLRRLQFETRLGAWSPK